ncbi:hypothetical protein AVEN_126061-1 [Araneus ventricosus]|uniref:Uncharacterized protein n=1 Tax=Araneus ventricosus TaxID=182803 RepID=A0A4Y2EXP3_ARAVE|nr:hypothetical protein AVEN_126061-1 [Araneus ventricosus]
MILSRRFHDFICSLSGVVRKPGEELPAQVSTWSSDRGSELRGTYQNNFRVSSKRYLNITPTGVVRKLGEGVPAQVSTWSCDQGSKLRCPPQNSRHVASKRDLNVTELFSLSSKSICILRLLNNFHLACTSH